MLDQSDRFLKDANQAIEGFRKLLEQQKASINKVEVEVAKLRKSVDDFKNLKESAPRRRRRCWLSTRNSHRTLRCRNRPCLQTYSKSTRVPARTSANNLICI